MEDLTECSFKSLLDRIDNILLDCDGVIWGGSGLLNKANVAINKLQSIGKRVFLVTNSSVRTHEAFIEVCKNYGINIEKESAVCVPTIMAQYLKEKKFEKKIYVIGSKGLVDELKYWGFQCVGSAVENLDDTDLYKAVANGTLGLDNDVGAVVVGFDRNFNYMKLLKATCYLSNPECLFLGCNIDEKYPVLNTNYSLPAGGVMVRSVESASGRKATIIGKPSSLMFEILATKYDLKPERTLMVGDTLQTDIEFGNNCGMETMLVLTGVSTKEDVDNLVSKNDNDCKLIPRYYLPSLGDILGFLE